MSFDAELAEERAEAASDPGVKRLYKQLGPVDASPARMLRNVQADRYGQTPDMRDRVTPAVVAARACHGKRRFV